MIGYFAVSRRVRPYIALMSQTRLQWRRFKYLMKIGLPIATQMTLESSAFVLSAIMVGWFGTVAIAAHQITVTLSNAAFMICINELGECHKREILEPLTILLAPFAPHITEQLWSMLGHEETIFNAAYPVCEEKFLVESNFEYPIMINGKLRHKQVYPLSATPAELQADIVTKPEVQRWLEGATPKKIIVVPGKIINIVK